MRERLFRIIWKLDDENWRPERPLMKALRDIAENATHDELEEILEAFK
jgi:hypothetical protein